MCIKIIDMIRKIFLLLFVSTLLFSCASRKKANRKKTSKIENSSKSKIEKEYKKCFGIPYRYGGTSYSGFDCSGFVQHIYKKALNINIARTTKDLLKSGKQTSKNKLKVGDLIFFKPLKKYNHVGIFMGESMFIHSSSSKGVMKSSLNNSYWKKYYHESRRIKNL